jgi:hypothetical protein
MITTPELILEVDTKKTVRNDYELRVQKGFCAGGAGSSNTGGENL